MASLIGSRYLDYPTNLPLVYIGKVVIFHYQKNLIIIHPEKYIKKYDLPLFKVIPGNFDYSDTTILLKDYHYFHNGKMSKLINCQDQMIQSWIIKKFIITVSSFYLRIWHNFQEILITKFKPLSSSVKLAVHDKFYFLDHNLLWVTHWIKSNYQLSLYKKLDKIYRDLWVNDKFYLISDDHVLIDFTHRIDFTSINSFWSDQGLILNDDTKGSLLTQKISFPGLILPLDSGIAIFQSSILYRYLTYDQWIKKDIRYLEKILKRIVSNLLTKNLSILEIIFQLLIIN